jgi:hypothetical protein
MAVVVSETAELSNPRHVYHVAQFNGSSCGPTSNNQGILYKSTAGRPKDEDGDPGVRGMRGDSISRRYSG